MRKFYSPELSPIILLSSALMAYLLAEQISGSGVLSVATMGLFFGNTIIRKKEDLQHFNELLGSIFVLLVFVLVGFLVSSSFTFSLIMKTLVLYLIAVFVRFQVITATIPSTKFTWKEKAFMTLVMPKGVAVAVVVFSLAVLNFGHLSPHLLDTSIQIIVLTMALSLLIATIVTRFSYYFLSTNESQEETTHKDVPTIIKGTVHVKTKPQLRTLANEKTVVKETKKSLSTTKAKSAKNSQQKNNAKTKSKQKTTKKK
jgi:NhaP-type Na+/H+ or K+/H+ antiporter